MFQCRLFASEDHSTASCSLVKRRQDIRHFWWSYPLIWHFVSNDSRWKWTSKRVNLPSFSTDKLNARPLRVNRPSTGGPIYTQYNWTETRKFKRIEFRLTECSDWNYVGVLMFHSLNEQQEECSSRSTPHLIKGPNQWVDVTYYYFGSHFFILRQSECEESEIKLRSHSYPLYSALSLSLSLSLSLFLSLSLSYSLLFVYVTDIQTGLLRVTGLSRVHITVNYERVGCSASLNLVPPSGRTKNKKSERKRGKRISELNAAT